MGMMLTKPEASKTTEVLVATVVPMEETHLAQAPTPMVEEAHSVMVTPKVATHSAMENSVVVTLTA